ncbi:MAG: hypothetical protein GF329_10570, partial [Candidatus Lokiarchaeota archaeon]|nr:hypothetical protein [Candidatus Lokiarchaeota archaeon]
MKNNFSKKCILILIIISLISISFGSVNAVDPRPSVILVCFGDSATKGAVEEHYPGYIEQWIKPDSDDVANKGRSGETSEQGLSRLEDIIDSGEFPNAQVYAIWEGGNDLIDWLKEIDRYIIFDPAKSWYPYKEQLEEKLDEIKDNLANMIDLIKTDGAIPIIGTYYYLM